MSETWQAFELRPGLTVRYRLAPNQFGRVVVNAITVEGDAVSTHDLRSIRLSDMEVQPDPEFPPPAEPLVRRDGRDGETHSRVVAEWYRYYAHFSHKPAKLMSDACGAPLQTVHHWIREARLRGLLPAARRGKAG